MLYGSVLNPAPCFICDKATLRAPAPDVSFRGLYISALRFFLKYNAHKTRLSALKTPVWKVVVTLAPQMEHFLYPCISVSCFRLVKSPQKTFGKGSPIQASNFEGDWTSPLSVTSKADQSDYLLPVVPHSYGLRLPAGASSNIRCASPLRGEPQCATVFS